MDTLYLNRYKMAVAIMLGDRARIRNLIVRGCTFATFTIRTKTQLAEKRFALYLEGRDLDTITGLMGTQRATVKQLHDLTPDQVWSIVCAPHPEELLGSLIKGLGCAKTSFGLACAGIGRQGCIDIHHEREYKSKVGTPTLWNKAIRRGDHAAYRELLALIWGAGDSAPKQWREWFDTLHTVTGYATTHTILTHI